jgi:hypothetical protein
MTLLQSARGRDPAPAPFAPISPTQSPNRNESPFRFVIRCLLEHKGNQWQAFSLELGLAVQADTALEARKKLESMIRSYLDDALSGQDREHGYELLSRKGTWRVYVLYYLASFGQRIKRIKEVRSYATFSKSLPLTPMPC